MLRAYYTYRIRVANNKRVQIEKRDSQQQSLGEPSGVLRYQEKLSELTPLLQLVKDGEINDSSQARLLGEILFDVLFDDGLRPDFVSFYHQVVVQKEKKLLRVELDIDEQGMPELAALPWEFLRLPARANLGTIWVGTVPDLVFSRRRSQWIPAQPIQLEQNEKLRIALVVSAPTDLSPVAYESVQYALKKLESEQASRVELLPIVDSANIESINAVLAKKPDIFHFIGHGRLIGNEIDRERGQIALTNELSAVDWVDDEFFAELFNQHLPKVVMLQACEGGMLSASQAFVGTASKVIQQNVPVVVAMQYEVSNATASRFALRFYKQLAEGDPVDIAAQGGRRAISHSPTQYRKRDFATPVIFMRVQDGYLFKPGNTPPDPPIDIPENLPRSGVVQFVGREQELELIHHQLQENEQGTVSAIAGMGGVGKTELALQYALKYKQSYQGGVCWIRAKGADVGTQIVQFGRLYLQLDPPDKLDVPAQVRFCWMHWQSGEVLVVLDDVINYDEIKLYLPPADPRFKVLITTRLRLGRAVKQIAIDVLNEAAALALLKSLVGAERIRQDLESAKQLCSWLEFLPLGLELVGRYLDRKPDLSFAEMQQRLRDKGLDERSLLKPDADMTAPLGVTTAFELSWEGLDEAAKQLGYVLSLFALAPIPWFLVERVALDQDPDDLETLRDDDLISLHLLRRIGEGTYRLHQLIREFLLKKLNQSAQVNDLKRAFCRAMVAEAKQIPQAPTQSLIATVTPIVPHIAEAAAVLTESLSNEDLIVPFTHLGWFYQGQGFYAQAEPWYKQCQEFSQKR